MNRERSKHWGARPDKIPEVGVEKNPKQILLSDDDYWRPNSLTRLRRWLDAAGPHNLQLGSHDDCRELFTSIETGEAPCYKQHVKIKNNWSDGL